MATWDESKRISDLQRHRLDLADCERVFDHPTLAAEDTRADYGEPRMNLLGWLDGCVVHMTYTERNGELRVISLRRATKHETRIYLDAVSGKR
ncbi:MAG: BrnT family toxin [Thiocapsa sp.]|uniref:BrnT family toxin n=1 Tax=Thiocapsa sp. TaxID=2024551 RepID=UPI001BCAC106|nr:BrnT family toxin [Thiocapsa sp.]QVL51025.1 MAG: BrnT family toxin [Thiocapsa sp.]